MGEIVNLRRERKRRARDGEAALAAAARLLHGRSKAERDAAAREADRASLVLDGARLRDAGAEAAGDAPGRE